LNASHTRGSIKLSLKTVELKNDSYLSFGGASAACMPAMKDAAVWFLLWQLLSSSCYAASIAWGTIAKELQHSFPNANTHTAVCQTLAIRGLQHSKGDFSLVSDDTSLWLQGRPVWVCKQLAGTSYLRWEHSMWLISKNITSLLTVEAYLPQPDLQQHNSDAAAALMPPLGSSSDAWLVYNKSTKAFEPSRSSIQAACPVCQSIVITGIADEALAVCNGAYLLETYKRIGIRSIVQWSHVSRPCVFLYDTAMLKWYIRLDARIATADDDSTVCTDDSKIEQEIEMAQPSIHCTATSRSTDITFTYNSSSSTDNSALYSKQDGVVVSADQDIVHISLEYSKDIAANSVHRAKVTVDYASAIYISQLNDVYSANARVTIHMDNVQGSHYIEMQLEDSNGVTIATGSMWLHMFDASKHMIVPRASARETSILELQRLR
jgi:hypothetical protein